MAQNLYNHAPNAYLILIPTVNFDFGEEFSDITNQGIITALEQIKQIINN